MEKKGTDGWLKALVILVAVAMLGTMIYLITSMNKKPEPIDYTSFYDNTNYDDSSSYSNSYSNSSAYEADPWDGLSFSGFIYDDSKYGGANLSGRIYNSNNYPVDGFFYICFEKNGREVKRTLAMFDEIPANSSGVWSHIIADDVSYDSVSYENNGIDRSDR